MKLFRLSIVAVLCLCLFVTGAAAANDELVQVSTVCEELVRLEHTLFSADADVAHVVHSMFYDYITEDTRVMNAWCGEGTWQYMGPDYFIGDELPVAWLCFNEDGELTGYTVGNYLTSEDKVRVLRTGYVGEGDL